MKKLLKDLSNCINLCYLLFLYRGLLVLICFSFWGASSRFSFQSNLFINFKADVYYNNFLDIKINCVPEKSQVFCEHCTLESQQKWPLRKSLPSVFQLRYFLLKLIFSDDFVTIPFANNHTVSSFIHNVGLKINHS